MVYSYGRVTYSLSCFVHTFITYILQIQHDYFLMERDQGMDRNSIALQRNKLLETMPEISSFMSTFYSINKRWGVAITTAMIETGHMDQNVVNLFTPLVEEMKATKTKYSKIQEQLVDTIIFEMVKKVVFEISDEAQFAINILKRNLFERTADVGYLSTDGEIVNYLKAVQGGHDANANAEQKAFVQQRLADYQYEYTVYNEIIILDTAGRVLANLDQTNHIIQSSDPLLDQTQAIDLHDSSHPDKYIETFRTTDLWPGRGNTLIYSQKIEDPETHVALGTLCLCFDFEQEMESIFKDLAQGNDQLIVAILDEKGRVISSNRSDVLAIGSYIPFNKDEDFQLFKHQRKTYLFNVAETDGYQGFYGLPWYGLTMIDTSIAFGKDQEAGLQDNALVRQLENFSSELAAIKRQSEELLSDMKIDSLNGQINAAKFNEKSFVEVLRFIEAIGREIDDLLACVIENLQQTVIASLFSEVQFRAFQGNNIADRNLYERANDVCWWALTPLFRELLTKHHEQGLTLHELKALTDNLQYINDLYTPYLRLVLVDNQGVVIATSNPPAELSERVLEAAMPKNQDFVGMKLDSGLVKQALSLQSSKEYCVSEFVPTVLYGGRHTYIYSTAVRDFKDSRRVVGTIQIVFDSEPQFLAMLSDTLPKDENKKIVEGCFGIFANRNKQVIASTNPDINPGDSLSLDDSFFQGERGDRQSSIVTFGKRTYSLGVQVSHGYREYKIVDGYVNDVVCLVFVPM